MRRDFLKLMLGGASLLAIASCSTTDPKFKTYSGPPVTRIDVFKSRRVMTFYSGTTPIKSYNFGLGYAPVGNKEYEGDGKTPEGIYKIDRRNDRSKFHLSLGINYPQPEDRARAKKGGYSPGGDIFIHGQPNQIADGYRVKGDWTEGCVAIDNHQIEELFAATPMGTEVEIRP